MAAELESRTLKKVFCMLNFQLAWIVNVEHPRLLNHWIIIIIVAVVIVIIITIAP